MQEVEVKMVDASSLAEYEIWAFFASLLSTAAVAFIVAYAQSFNELGREDSGQPVYLIVAAVFIALLLGAIARVWFIRKKIRQGSVSYSMSGTRSDG